MITYYTALKIFGANWPVYIGDATDNKILETAEGCCEYVPAKIWIRSDVAPDRFLLVLLHEINHAIVFECPAMFSLFNRRLGKKMSPDEREEFWNASYSAVLTAVLKDNHMLIRPRIK